MATILTDWGDFTADGRDGLQVSTADAERITGWTAKPEGMCRGDLCVPVTEDIVYNDTVDLVQFWRLLGNPIAADIRGEVWVLGAGADSRTAALAGLEAPDFALPDLGGLTHRLSDLRGKKVFLTTWASW